MKVYMGLAGTEEPDTETREPETQKQKPKKQETKEQEVKKQERKKQETKKTYPPKVVKMKEAEGLEISKPRTAPSMSNERERQSNTTRRTPIVIYTYQRLEDLGKHDEISKLDSSAKAEEQMQN